MHVPGIVHVILVRVVCSCGSPIRGFTGNCLFHALSDQIHGNQQEHSAIRAHVVNYMREHAAYYKQFVDALPGGATRRNPKRKNAGAYSSPANYVPPSQADIDKMFEMHLQSMATGGVYGDNMEIVAFASAYGWDVKIYQRDFAYMVSGSDDEAPRPVAHVAYHLWEHYSSIRNLDGPHSGSPHVQPKALTLEEEQLQKERLASTPMVLPWMLKTVSQSLPFLVDTQRIKKALETAKGSVDLAVSNLLDEEYGSASSQQESSSVERDHDSDDDMLNGPNKKQDRRMSRASKAQKERSSEARHALSNLTTFDGSQESIHSFASTNSSNAGSTPATQPTELEESDPNNKPINSASASRSNSPARPPVRLKLHPPKPPDQSRVGKTQQRQPGPRATARDRKELKKQQQKQARKERAQLQAAGRGIARSQSPSAAGLALRQKGMTETPPVETLRTLYI